MIHRVPVVIPDALVQAAAQAGPRLHDMHTKDLRNLSDKDSQALFRFYSGLEGPDNDADIAGLCKFLGGIPFAIELAARQITQLAERCKTTSKPDPLYCAVAAYHGSWDRPDTQFADAVRATVEKGNAPNFDMPKDAYFDASDIASETPIPGPHAALTTSAPTPDDRARGWSSALFPARPAKPDNTSTDVQNGDETVEQRRSPGLAAAAPSPSKGPVDSLFVPRSSERRP